jgi:hypothetical protein
VNSNVAALAPHAFADRSMRVFRSSGGTTATSATKAATEGHVTVAVNGPEHPVLDVTVPVVVNCLVDALNVLVYVLVSKNGGIALALVSTSVAAVAYVLHWPDGPLVLDSLGVVGVPAPPHAATNRHRPAGKSARFM